MEEFDFYSETSPVLSLARTIEMKDPYTAGHTWRVAHYARLLSEELDFADYQVKEIFMAGCLHDVGKIAVPDEILCKPGRLTDEEFAIMKRHPQDGFDFLRFDHDFAGALDVVLMHHESYDGSGYPVGLAGEMIPPTARVFAIADTFDAMTSSRPYRRGLDPEVSIAELNRKRGTQFDPNMVAVFERLYRANRLQDIIGHTDEGIRAGCCPKCGPVIELRRNTKPGAQVRCHVCRSKYVVVAFENSQARLTRLESADGSGEDQPAP